MIAFHPSYVSFAPDFAPRTLLPVIRSANNWARTDITVWIFIAWVTHKESKYDIVNWLLRSVYAIYKDEEETVKVARRKSIADHFRMLPIALSLTSSTTGLDAVRNQVNPWIHTLCTLMG